MTNNVSGNDGSKSSNDRVRRFREKLRSRGLKRYEFLLTDEEKFYLERTLQSIRSVNGVPAMIRNQKGQLKPIDI